MKTDYAKDKRAEKRILKRGLLGNNKEVVEWYTSLEGTENEWSH